MKRETSPTKQNGDYVQYGCGLCAPEGWKNFDSSPTLRLQRLPLVGRVFASNLFKRNGVAVFPGNVSYGDIVKGLPVSPGSCDAIYCSHVLEHLTLNDFRVALRNSYTYIRKDGIFRFVLPDLKEIARDYVSSSAPDASHNFMVETCLGKESRPRGLEGMLRSWLGSGSHYWMWDYEAIRIELEEVGFRNIRRAAFGDSLKPQFKVVEDRERWERCLGVEAEK